MLNIFLSIVLRCHMVSFIAGTSSSSFFILFHSYVCSSRFLLPFLTLSIALSLPSLLLFLCPHCYLSLSGLLLLTLSFTVVFASSFVLSSWCLLLFLTLSFVVALFYLLLLHRGLVYSLLQLLCALFLLFAAVSS